MLLGIIFPLHLHYAQKYIFYDFSIFLAEEIVSIVTWYFILGG